MRWSARPAGVRCRVVVDGCGCAALPSLALARFALPACSGASIRRRAGSASAGRASGAGCTASCAWSTARSAFCGGINILDDFHDPNHGTLTAPRLDFDPRVTGPIVAEDDEPCGAVAAHRSDEATAAGRAVRRAGSLRAPAAAAAQAPEPPEHAAAAAALLLRDNLRHRAWIERAYLRAIGQRRKRSSSPTRTSCPAAGCGRAGRAARRGVQVRLLLQGRYEYFMQYYAARPCSARCCAPA
jgi:cardiolipin synthase